MFVGDGGSREHEGAKKTGMSTVRAAWLEDLNGKELKSILPFVDRTFYLPGQLTGWATENSGREITHKEI